MKKSLNTLGIKKYFLQNISTRMLKENIEITFEKISEIKKKYKIDTIFCPAYEGGHQDHDVANFICSRFKNKCKVYEFAEYNFFDNRIRSNNFFIPSKKDNIILAIPSNGIHSNGYSLVRSILKKNKLPKFLRKEILKPTQIYSKEIIKFY